MAMGRLPHLPPGQARGRHHGVPLAALAPPEAVDANALSPFRAATVVASTAPLVSSPFPPSVAQLQEPREQPFPHSLRLPLREAPPGSRGGALLCRHGHPAAAGGQDREDALQGPPVSGPGPAGAGPGGQKRPDELPLLSAPLPALPLRPPAPSVSPQSSTPSGVSRRVHRNNGAVCLANGNFSICNRIVVSQKSQILHCLALVVPKALCAHELLQAEGLPAREVDYQIGHPLPYLADKRDSSSHPHNPFGHFSPFHRYQGHGLILKTEPPVLEFLPHELAHLLCQRDRPLVSSTEGV